jgi:predicted transcriptional regulator
VDRKTPEADQLGKLEAEVMNVVWDEGRATVHTVLRRLNSRRRGRELAYTTVMTVLARLVDKAFLAREKEGRAFVYRPTVSRETVADSALRRVVDRFFDGMSSRAVARLLGRPEAVDARELEELESAARSKRAKRRSRS